MNNKDSPLPTRSSPARACKAKAAKLNAQNKKAKKTAALKGSKKAVAAAKAKVVDGQAAKRPPLAPVKVKEESLPKRRVFTEEEDIALCKAWVNCSMDPVVGADQKKDHFWTRIHNKFYKIYNEESDVVVDGKKWPIKSVKDRFGKIEKEVKTFNIYYRQISREHDKSGWTPEMKIEAAKNLFAEVIGRPFKHSLCARILHQAPKYSPEEDNKDAEDPNPVAMAQGRNLDTPIGNKKAKKMKLLEKLGEDSAAASAQADALNSVAAAAAGLAKSMDRKRQVDSMHKQVNALIKLGMKDEAMNMLHKITQYEEELAAQDKAQQEKDSKPAAVPQSINVASTQNTGEVEKQDGGQDEEEEEEEEDPNAVSQTYKEAVHFALDTGDEDEDEDEDSSHPSQPSDDSRLVKHVPV